MNEKQRARINFMKERVVNTIPEMDLENARILTESFRETGGEPLAIQKAKSFRRQCQEKTIKIWDQELIVGCAGSKMRGGILSADTCWSILDKELDTINERKYDPFILKPEDRQMFLDVVKPFWEGRSTYEAWLKQIPDDVRALRDSGQIYIDKKAVRGWGETTAGYKQIIDEGIESIMNTIKAEREALDLTDPGAFDKDNYLQALLISAEGICIMAERYAKEAERLAELEKDEERKAELLTIAETCHHVPRYPARTFQEAIQSFYFYHISIFMEQNAAAYNPGRMDQYFYPYYKVDIESGRITEDEGQELLECLWVKFSEPCVFQDATTARYSAGYPMFQTLCCGGIDAEGRDAVNDISYMMLQATQDVQLYQPNMCVRYSMAKNPTKFLKKVAEVISLGTGFPAFYNDDVGIRMLMNKGIPLKEAYDWNPAGCVETNLDGRLRHYSAFADINLGGIIEFALTNGVNRKTGRKVATETGDPTTFETYEDFENAVKEQLKYSVRICVKGSHIIDDICMDRIVPALSLSFRECVKNAKDYAWGGAKYNTGNGIILIGVADLINSMEAIRDLVYDRKLVSMEDMVKALDADFEGYEEIQKLCKESHKYGNDDDDVNDITSHMLTFIADEIEKYHSKFGQMTPGILPVSGNTPFGQDVGALPSGRKAWMPLADGISPNGGTDLEGPAAVIKSVASIPHSRYTQGTLLNMKLEPDMVKTENGIRQLMALLRSLCTLDVYHVQFNVIDKETLLAAQKKPENYKGLLVRVAGYTAYFTELGREVQDEIIARTAQSNFCSTC